MDDDDDDIQGLPRAHIQHGGSADGSCIRGWKHSEWKAWPQERTETSGRTGGLDSIFTGAYPRSPLQKLHFKPTGRQDLSKPANGILTISSSTQVMNQNNAT